jgi:hypothetical protein
MNLFGIFAGDELPFDQGIKHGLMVYMRRLWFFLRWASIGFLFLRHPQREQEEKK